MQKDDKQIGPAILLIDSISQENQISHENLTTQAQQSSNYSEQYQNKMKLFKDLINTPEKITETQEAVKKYLLKSQNFFPSINLKIKYESTNRQVIILNAKWGWFEMDINILNIEGQNLKHGVQLSSGGFGSIYLGEFHRRNFAIKCLPVKTTDSRLRAIKQFFLTKVCSLLRVGPKMEAYFGFDIIMFSQCIEFGLEQCEPTSPQTFNSHHLFQNLAMLHSIKLMHQDIKPENIMYSPSYQKMVFIDFGLSRFIQENQGEKTKTTFVGSINFCSPEMRRLYIQKKERKVDLYYNDLFSLDQSISFMEINEDKIEKYVEQLPLQRFDYLKQVLLKCFLFNNLTTQFMELWENSILKEQTTNVDSYISKILFFLQELTPNKSRQKVFKNVVTETHFDTEIYSKIKILYEVAQKNLCESQIFRRQDKYQYFNTICQEFFTRQKHQSNRDAENIKIILHCKDEQFKLPFLRYFDFYLEYISYINNKYQVDSQQREDLARNYCKLYMNEQPSQELKGRQLIQKTILHGLQKCLYEDGQTIEQTQYIILLFKLYDFIFILDLGTCSQVIQWVEAIFNHKTFKIVYQFLLLSRVKHSIFMSQFRVTPKKDVPRVHFISKLEDWVSKKWAEKKYPAEINIQQLPEKFMSDYGFQILFFQNLITHSIKEPQTSNEQQSDIISLFYGLRNRDRSTKIYFFLGILYRYAYYKRDNASFCSQICKIFQNNIRDKGIMDEFSFHFWTDICFKHTNLISTESITKTQIQRIFAYLAKITTQELILFKPMMQSLMLHIMNQKEHIKKLNLDPMLRPELFYYRFFEAMIKDFRFKYMISQRQHKCLDPLDLLSMCSHSQGFQVPKTKEFEDLLNQLKYQFLAKCHKCQAIIASYHDYQQLNEYYTKYIKLLQQNGSQDSRQTVEDLFFSLYQKLIKKAKQSQLNYSQKTILYIIINYGQRMCWLSDYFEAKYHGIENYYKMWIIKQRAIQYLFPTHQPCFALFKILNLLKTTKYEQFVESLFMFSEFLKQSLQKRHYLQILEMLKSILQKYDENKLDYLFRSLRAKYLKGKSSCKYICLFYAIILPYTKSTSLQNQILKSIYDNLSHVHFHFKRLIGIRIFCHWLNKQKIESHKRRWLRCNNRLLKDLTIESMTIPFHRKQNKDSLMRKSLDNKMGNFEKCLLFVPPLRFRTKAKSRYFIQK